MFVFGNYSLRLYDDSEDDPSKWYARLALISDTFNTFSKRLLIQEVSECTNIQTIYLIEGSGNRSDFSEGFAT